MYNKGMVCGVVFIGVGFLVSRCSFTLVLFRVFLFSKFYFVSRWCKVIVGQGLVGAWSCYVYVYRCFFCVGFGGRIVTCLSRFRGASWRVIFCFGLFAIILVLFACSSKFFESGYFFRISSRARIFRVWIWSCGGRFFFKVILNNVEAWGFRYGKGDFLRGCFE